MELGLRKPFENIISQSFSSKLLLGIVWLFVYNRLKLKEKSPFSFSKLTTMIDILETTKDLHMVFAQIPSHTFLKVYTKTSLKTVTTHNQFVDRLGYVWWQKPTRHCRDFKRSNKKLCGSLEFCALSIYRGYKTYKQRYVVKWLDYYPCAPCNNAILPSICLR